MIEEYFSDQELAPRPRTEEAITQPVWDGIAAAIRTRVWDASFGQSFPRQCEAGSAVMGTDWDNWAAVMAAEIPELKWVWPQPALPATLTVLDLIQFCHRYVSKATPIPGGCHSAYRHDHFEFHRTAGQAEFLEQINLIFARNGLAYELQEGGRIVRLGPTVPRERRLPLPKARLREVFREYFGWDCPL